MESVDKQSLSFGEIALALAGDYESIYVINSLDDSYVEYIPEGGYKELIIRSSGDDFYADTVINCRILVHPDDQETFLAHFRKENVMESLKDGKSFNLNYRLIINGEPLHYFLKTIKSTNDNVVIGVQNIDEQKKKELAANEEMLIYRRVGGALASRYEAIYYVDTNTNRYLCYSTSAEYDELGITLKGDDFFDNTENELSKVVYPEDAAYVREALNKESLLQNLDEKGTLSYVFRQNLGGGIKYVRMNIVRPIDDEDHIVIGVINIDSQIKREQMLAEENMLFNEVAMALASRYEVIYRVDTVTNEYYEFSASAKYSKLKAGSRGDDFFADTQKNMKNDIYPEDYPMMAKVMEKETLLNRLKEVFKLNISYRLMIDGRPQYMSLIIMNSNQEKDHIIIALENVDQAKQKEIEYEATIVSAIDMANKDALTCVKNKHAYVNTEMQLDAQLEAGESTEFGIIVCDINGLKTVNDEQGHSAGDVFIKDACAIICEIFDHSPVFRIGGDEFVVLLKGSDYENRYDLLKTFYNRQIENRRNGLVTLAYGMAEYEKGIDNRVQDVFERADSIMYENKNRFKNMPVNEEAESIESYSFVRFYELYEQLLNAFVAFDTVDQPLIESLLIKIATMFRLSKGVTRVYKNPQEEAMGLGETLCCFDRGEGEEILKIRVVTSVMSIATMTIYMDPKEEPLSTEEFNKMELVVRTVLSFISRNRLKDIVYKLAYFDDVGYPNLRTLNNYIDSIAGQGGFKGMMAVRYNLRHISLINQEFGREAGDRIMKIHFDTLDKMRGGKGILVRLGGDNFVMICPKDKVNDVIGYLFEAVIKIDEVSSVKVLSSAGILMDSEDLIVNNAGDVMNRIINAYRVAQSGGKDRIVFYSDRLIAEKQKFASVQQHFSDAIANEEFVPFYQPKVDVNTGEIIGGEALCRWFRKGKIVPPCDFIPALEQTSDICKLDLYMLEHVCRDQRKWLDGGEGRTLVPMSINFSRKHIMNMDLPDTIARIMDRYNIPHDCIEVELTETTTDVEFSDLKRVAAGLRDRGIPTSIDDFGMGFSSLNLLKGIPWTTLKIDKNFLPEEDDAENSEKRIMFKSVVSLAKSLGLNCIAEGVETAYQVNVLKECGCDIAQGYYYDKPLPKEEFEARLSTKKYEG
ncbi:MAG: GGDEF domain-containing protein [Clostridiales bacterium]|nr:GGDEF domain-containing protein [Clostridiales bacterium]